jgi:glycosyltransferase involved in cell wall biosynthesis
MIDLSLILPVYNQEDIIHPVYKSIFSKLRLLKINFECILVENGSTDNTKKITRNLADKYPRTTAISVTKGYGSAVISGLKIAKGKFVSYMPSDGQVDLTVFPELWKLALTRKYQIVKIRRINRESVIRTVISRFLSQIISLKYRTPNIDINGSPRILRLADARSLNLKYRDSFIDSEMVIKAKMLDWKIKEIPMKNLDRFGGKSSRNWRTYFEFIKNVITYRS